MQKQNIEQLNWKVDVLIWIFTKLFQYFDDDSFTIIIDHITFKFAFQIKTTKRRFSRLNEWFMYLFIYLSKMKIIHKVDKIYNNANELFKLFIIETINFLNLRTHTIHMFILSSFSMSTRIFVLTLKKFYQMIFILIEFTSKFKNKLKRLRTTKKKHKQCINYID